MLQDEHFDIVGVVSQPDRPAGRSMKVQPTAVKEVASQAGLPILQVERLGTESDLQQLRDWNAECAVVVAFGQILGSSFLDLYPKRVVNVHASLLPRWRGAAPIQRAIMGGDLETGVALQIMVKKLDAGDVLGVRKIEIGRMDSVQLHEALKPLASDLLHVELMDYMRGNLAGLPQDESLVTLAPKLDKKESRLDWRLIASVLDRQIRGLKLGPGAYCMWGGQRLKILSAAPVQIPPSSQVDPGTLLGIDLDAMMIACGQNSQLRVTEVQPESKAKMTAQSFIQGARLTTGEKFD